MEAFGQAPMWSKHSLLVPKLLVWEGHSYMPTVHTVRKGFLEYYKVRGLLLQKTLLRDGFANVLYY